MRAKIKWLFLRIRDFVEVFIPVITFSALFLAFVYSVFSRYILNRPPGVGDGGTGSDLHMDCSVRSMLCAQAE